MPIIEGDHDQGTRETGSGEQVVPLSDVMESLVKQHGVESVLKAVDHLRFHAAIPPAPTDHASMLSLANDALEIARSLGLKQNEVECTLKGSRIHRIVNCCLSLGNLITFQYKPKEKSETKPSASEMDCRR